MAPQSESEMNEMKGKPYRELIGGLLYLANSTRPDLAFAASMLSRFCSNPGIVHWKMAKRVLRYIQATVNYGIHYEKCDQKLCAYVDSDWAGDIDDRKSSSGNMIILANGPGLVANQGNKNLLRLASCLLLGRAFVSTSAFSSLW
ncbi:uncharacterized protein [Centruroides vittatus]|uniref:uncharacterized protein n=1 Tax=Centruroides vittatus TaxID=120091 RepID=UPI00351069C3